MSLKPEDKVLYFDIETSHNAALIFGGGKQYVGHDQIMKERKIFSICYMMEGDKKVTKLKMDLKRHNGHDMRVFDDDADKGMLMTFMKAVGKAKLLVAHNGRRFDIARLQARLVKYKLPDLPPVLFDDSYTFAKHIGFTFHKLDYLGKCLGLGKKMHTNVDLWIKIMVGTSKEQAKALNYMVEYNAQDVILLRKVYLRLRPYCKSKLNLAVSRDNPEICPGCGSKLRKDGFVTRGIGKVQQLECTNSECRRKFTNGSNLISKPSRFPR